MKRIALQFAGLWLAATGGAVCVADWNLPTFGNTQRIAMNDAPMLPPAAPTPAPMDAAAPAEEAGVPMSAGPIAYEGAGYGYGYGGGEACCEPENPCSATLWDGFWGAKKPWCLKGHGCGHGHGCGCGHGLGHHSLLPQINWMGGCCSHRACWNGGYYGHGHGAACGCDTCGGGEYGIDAGYAAPAPAAGCNCNH